ncbi:hypothetical protein KC669_04850 [Candidatus Dojkabacteria bacterium]|uniref:Uncharacterized protein n=1 Tax=Candidatus Dojkabacteria bacterium TaxID=2099670 RepID=A0A955LAR9_9BACT|nr:hypothetical protein [Candidatus Dojkabacteria bacterium]
MKKQFTMSMYFKQEDMYADMMKYIRELEERLDGSLVFNYQEGLDLYSFIVMVYASLDKQAQEDFLEIYKSITDNIDSQLNITESALNFMLGK